MRRGKIGLDNPWAGFESIDQIVDFRIVLKERGPRRRYIGLSGISRSDKRKRAGTVQGIGGGAGDPIIDSGIKTIVKRERQRERANRVVGLAALAERRQLRHHDAALRIYVLKRKGGLGADQSLKLAPPEREIVAGRDFEVSRRKPSEQIPAGELVPKVASAVDALRDPNTQML